MKKKTLESAVYSFIYPGRRGMPSRITTKGYGAHVQISDASGYKSTWYIDALATRVTSSAEFKKQDQAKPSTPVSVTDKTGDALARIVRGVAPGWIIGNVVDNSHIVFANSPVIHASEEAAYTEVERLSKAHPGTMFVVVRTVRTSVFSEVKVKDL